MLNYYCLTVAWIEARDHIILEANTMVNLGFTRTRGDRSERSRAYAYTEGGSATEGNYNHTCLYTVPQ